MYSEILDILLIEQSQSDANLAILTLQQLTLLNPIKHIKSPEDALHYLLHCEEHCPLLIMLSASFDGHMDGFMFAKQFRQSIPSWNIPLIMFTSEDHQTQLVEGLGLHNFIVKPLTAEKLLLAMAPFRLKWLIVNE